MKRENSRLAGAFGVASILWAAIAAAGVTSHAGQTTTKKGKPSAGNAKRITFPADRDAAVVAVTKVVLRQIYAGKVDAALTTPAFRAKYPPAKIRALKRDLGGYGPLKGVKFVDRTPGEGKDVATLKITLGDTVFIGTMTVTTDNRLDAFLLLEE